MSSPDCRPLSPAPDPAAEGLSRPPEPESATRSSGHPFRTAAIGTAVAAWTYLDALIFGPIIIVLAAWLNWLVVFGVAAVVWTGVNLACCNWIDRHWDRWIEGSTAKRIEGRLEKARRSRLMRHPVNWITRGPGAWFGLAAVLLNPSVVVVGARLIGGRPVGERRIWIASLAYSVIWAAVFAALGLAFGDVIRAA